MRTDDEGVLRLLELHSEATDAAPRRIWSSNGIFHVQFPLPAIVEKAKGGVALLLNFGKNDAGADRMNGAGGNENNIPARTGRHCTRSTIEPSAIAVRSSATRMQYFNPSAT